MLRVDRIGGTIVVAQVVGGLDAGAASLTRGLGQGVGGRRHGGGCRKTARRGLGRFRGRRVVDDDDLLGDAVLVEFVPVGVFPSPGLCRGAGGNPIVRGRHCRRRRRDGRQDLWGLSKREGVRGWIDGVGIGGRQASGPCSGRGRIGRIGLVGRVNVWVRLLMRVMMRRVSRGRGGGGRHDGPPRPTAGGSSEEMKSKRMVGGEPKRFSVVGSQSAVLIYLGLGGGSERTGDSREARSREPGDSRMNRDR